MRLQLMTWAEAESYLEAYDGVIVPIGSTEQHGPNGLIGTDALTADAIAIETGELAGALVAPVISVGMAQHHMAFAGSMTLKPSTLVQVICDNVMSLAKHGFRKFYFINGHGGNISTITTAFQEIHAGTSLEGGSDTETDSASAPAASAPAARNGSRRSDLYQLHVVVALRNWWIAPKIKELSAELYGDKEGYHATPSEVAVTQYLFPHHIKQAEMEPAPKVKPEFGDAEDYRRRYPDGRMASHPALARPEHGERIFRAATEFLAKDYAEFVADG